MMLGPPVTLLYRCQMCRSREDPIIRKLDDPSPTAPGRSLALQIPVPMAQASLNLRPLSSNASIEEHTRQTAQTLIFPKCVNDLDGFIIVTGVEKSAICSAPTPFPSTEVDSTGRSQRTPAPVAR